MLFGEIYSLFIDTIAISFVLSMLTLAWYYTVNKKCSLPKSKVYINELSSCFPKNQYLQSQMKDMFIQNYCGGQENILEKDLDFIDRVFSKTLINTCQVNLPRENLFEQMERVVYTTYVKDTLLILACAAAQDVLVKSHLLPCQVTHLVFGTMTATVRAPSLDVCIMRQLGLEKTVKRLNVEGMGCLTGFRLTGLCHDIAAENEHNIVLLVVCDVRSALGNQLTLFKPMQPVDKSNVIVSAMFRDSGGAAILSQKRRTTKELQIMGHRSMLIPDSFDQVLLQEFNHGAIHLFLDKMLPDSIFTHVPSLVTTFLAEHSINVSQCLFALHTGGPKIIDGIQKCLNLDPEQLFGTWFVMKKYGNLSGSSNLVVLEHIMRFREAANIEELQHICVPTDFSNYSHVVGLSFGPGLGVECVLFQM